MKKKILSILLSVALISTLLVSCGGSTTTSGSSKDASYALITNSSVTPYNENTA